jgi:hypothetical protein
MLQKAEGPGRVDARAEAQTRSSAERVQHTIGQHRRARDVVSHGTERVRHMELSARVP